MGYECIWPLGDKYNKLYPGDPRVVGNNCLHTREINSGDDTETFDDNSCYYFGLLMNEVMQY